MRISDLFTSYCLHETLMDTWNIYIYIYIYITWEDHENLSEHSQCLVRDLKAILLHGLRRRQPVSLPSVTSKTGDACLP